MVSNSTTGTNFRLFTNSFYKLYLQLFLPSKAFFYFSLSILLFFAFFLQAFMV